MTDRITAEAGHTIPSAAELRENARCLRMWFDSVYEQQREAIGMFGGGYGVERAAKDALDCSFRLAVSAVSAMEKTAEAIDALAQAIEARAQGTAS